MSAAQRSREYRQRLKEHAVDVEALKARIRELEGDPLASTPSVDAEGGGHDPAGAKPLADLLDQLGGADYLGALKTWSRATGGRGRKGVRNDGDHPVPPLIPKP